MPTMNQAHNHSNTGLVIARYGQQIDVEMHTGNIKRISLHRKFSHIITGDKIVLEQNDQNLIVKECLPRTSVLQRFDTRSKIKAIAANIDQLCLVIAPEPIPSSGLIDDYLIMAEALHIKPVIVLNKIDMLTSSTANLALEKNLEIYKKLSYPVISISALNATHISNLIELLSGQTSILVGQSGVGKSSIIQQLIPDIEIRTAELSIQSKHGKHTTTTAKLYHLSCRGNLIDSPGVRSFTLWPMSREKIAHCFIEFRPYLGHCQFNDCRHITEPGCTILEALKVNAIAESRYQSYQRLGIGLL